MVMDYIEDPQNIILCVPSPVAVMNPAPVPHKAEQRKLIPDHIALWWMLPTT
jgi:hypothetical protein